MKLRTYLLSSVVVLAATAALSAQTAKPADSSAEIKPAAPAFNKISLDGKKLDLISLRGKVVVLNFWFIECRPCVEEMPTLNGLVDEFKDNDVVFIAPTWDNEATLGTFLKIHPFKYQVVANARDMILGSYGDGTGNMPFPMHLVIDKEGKIDMKVTGALVTKQGTKKLDDFRNTITRLVNVPFDKAS